ncbi:MAG: DUF4114 domain-containing protein [Phormidesmis sp.]
MKKLAAKLSLVTLSTLSLLSISVNAQAASLRGDLLTKFSGFVQAEGKAFSELSLPKLDASQLYWDGNPNSVEVFFIDEGAGFRNQLLYSANDQPLEMIFEDVSSPYSTLSNSDGPLALGQGKALPTFFGPTQLSFFIRSNGFNGGQDVYGSDAYSNSTVAGQTVNGDGLSHLVAYNYFDEVSKENYTIIGFEDLWGKLGATGGKNQGSDRDFNDVVFAVKGLSSRKPEQVPEPSALLGLLAVGALGAKQLKRQIAA